MMETQVTQPLEESLVRHRRHRLHHLHQPAEQSQITIRFGRPRPRCRRQRRARPRRAGPRPAARRGRRSGRSRRSTPTPSRSSISLSSERHSPLDVTDYADRFSTTGCRPWPASPTCIFGERRYAMRVWLDAERLAAYRPTAQDVEDALRRENVECRRAGSRAPARVHRRQPDRPAHAGGVRGHHHPRGRRLSGPPQRRRPRRARRARRPHNVRFNGRSAVALGVVEQSTANPLDVAEGGRDGAAIDPARAARRHAHRHRVRQLDLHPALDPGGVRRPSARRSCWSCW